MILYPATSPFCLIANSGKCDRHGPENVIVFTGCTLVGLFLLVQGDTADGDQSFASVTTQRQLVCPHWR
jgi:hypothetical protein